MSQCPDRRGARRTTIIRISILMVTVITVGLPPASLGDSSAVLPNFTQVDYFWAQNPQRFQTLWQSARTQTVRVAEIGDSQETSPGGAGAQFIPLLNYEMWKRFGNVPETPVEGCSSYGGGAPWADWLMRGACATPGPVASRLAADQILPNIGPKAFANLNGRSNSTGGYYGQLTMLQPNAIDVDPGAAIPTTDLYFNTAGVVKARIFAATNASSGEIAYRALPIAGHVPSYFSPITTAGALTLGLESPDFAVKWGDTDALDFAGNPYMALEASGSDDQKLTDIVGLRFFNETHPEGVVVYSVSHGGYKSADFLANHANAGEMFHAFGFQAAVLHFGANDAGNNVTATQFGTNLTAVIATIRSWSGDANLPVILVADVYRDGLTAAQQAQLDQYAAATLAIAQADSNVMIINSRRLMEDIGWNASSGQSSQFLLDGVHYTAHGSRVLAAAEVAAMMNEVRVTGCMSDPDSVALQSDATLTVVLGGPTACTTYGQFKVAQSLTLNQPTLNVELATGFTPSSGQSFQILSWGTLSGSFNSVGLPDLPPELQWDTSQLYVSGTISVATPPAATDPTTPTTPTAPTTPTTPTDPTAPTAPSTPGGTSSASGGGTGSASTGSSGGGGSIDLSCVLGLALMTLLRIYGRRRTSSGLRGRLLECACMNASVSCHQGACSSHFLPKPPHRTTPSAYS